MMDCTYGLFEWIPTLSAGHLAHMLSATNEIIDCRIMKIDMAQYSTNKNLYQEVGTIKIFIAHPTVEHTPSLFSDEFDPSCRGFATCWTDPTDQIDE